jgi:hypothetical protein
MSASVAVGNAASRERDRDMETTHEDGRPKALGERARQRWNAIAKEGFGKIVVSQTAHLGAKEIARRVGNETVKRVFKEIGKRPIAAASVALFAFDTARDGFRLAKGDIDGKDFAERVGGNGAGLAGAAGGAWVGSMVGTLAMPLVGTMVGSVIGVFLNRPFIISPRAGKSCGSRSAKSRSKPIIAVTGAARMRALLLSSARSASVFFASWLRTQTKRAGEELADVGANFSRS